MSGAMKWLGFGGAGGASSTVYQGIQVQTSISTAGIPIVYGQTRLAPNLIWYGDFQQTGSSGGKGGQSSKTGGAGNTYMASVIMALCEGPVGALIGVWLDGAYQAITHQPNNFDYVLGTATQAPWSWLASNYPAQSRAYPYTCYLTAQNYPLDSSAQLPNHNFEVAGFCQFTSTAGATMEAAVNALGTSGITVWSSTTAYTSGQVAYGLTGGTYVCIAANTNEPPPNSTYWTQIFPDCNPALILQDLLTNVRYGVGMPSAYLGDWTAYTAYCAANTLLLSLTVNTNEAASSICQRIMEITNSEMFWSDGLLKIVPRGDISVSGNGYTFTPDLTPIFDLTDDQFISTKDDDPVSLAISDRVDAFNCVTVNYTNRINDYNTVPIQVKDQTSIDLYGLRNESPQQHVEICDPLIAQTSAQLRLQRIQSTRNVYTWSLSVLFCMLEPMDLVTLTDTALGVNDALVRITSVEEDEDGNLKFTGEEVMIGAAQPAEFNISTALGYNANYNGAPSNTNAPILFMPPTQLSSGTPTLSLIASGGENWGGCEVWVSGDGSTYRYQGQITQSATQGVLSAILASGADPDTTNTLAVNLSESLGQLTSVSLSDANLNRSMCYVDGELISYETATLTGVNAYSLTYLRRGQYGTPITAHAAGAPFASLASDIFSVPITTDQVGTNIWVKLPAMNAYGGGLQDLSAVTAYEITITAPPPPVPVTSLTATYAYPSVILTWPASEATGSTVKMELWLGPTFSSATAVALVAATTTSYAAPAPGLGTFTYWIVGADVFGNASTTPQSATITITQLGAPGAITLTPSYQSILLSYTLPTESDYGGTLVYMSTTSGFTPGSGNLVYTGTGSTISIAHDTSGALLVPGTTYYFKVAFFSALGTTGLNYSSQYSASPLSSTQVAAANLYQWKATTPSAPTGNSTFTWATGTNGSYTASDGWTTAIPANPGTAGLSLWIAATQVTGYASSPTSAINWAAITPAIYATSTNGATGLAGPTLTISGVTGFNENSGGAFTPASATLTAVTANIISPTYSWSITGAAPSSATTAAITIDPLSAATSVTASVTVNGSNLSAPMTQTVTMPITFNGVAGEAGANGLMSAFPSIYTWTSTSTPPAYPTSMTTYTWSTGSYSAPSGWYTSSPSNTTPGDFLWVLTIPLTVSATTTTSTLDWTNTSNAIRSIAYNGTPGKNGSATFVVVRSADDGSAPTNAEVSAVIGRNPIAGDICTLNYNGGNNSEVWRYTTGWSLFVTYITGSLIVAGTITGSNIAALTITSGNIAANTITTNNIAVGTITAGNIAAGTITATQMTAGTITAASGILDNAAVGTLTIAGNAVTVPASAYSSGPTSIGTSWSSIQSIYMNRSAGVSSAVPMVGIISYTHQGLGSPGGSQTVYVEVIRSGDGAQVFWAAYSANEYWTTPYAASFQDSYQGATYYTMNVYVSNDSALASYAAMTLLETRR